MDKPLVFVVGDFLIDLTVEGLATHIAPDAPVTVFEMHQRFARAGGMWNAAANVKAAGAELRCFGVTGPSDEILKIRSEVENGTFGDGESNLIIAQGRTTQVKRRYVGQYGYQTFRADTVKDGPIDSVVAQEVVAAMRAAARRHRDDPAVIFIADYGCGMVTKELVVRIREEFPASKMVVDPYPTTDAEVYRGVDYITPNFREAEVLCERLHITEAAELTQLADVVIVKQGPDPVIVMMREGDAFDVQPPKRQLVDACGAGDAFTGYLCFELANGAELEAAVRVAAHAGAVAVESRGVVVVQREAVIASMVKESA